MPDLTSDRSGHADDVSAGLDPRSLALETEERLAHPDAAATRPAGADRAARDVVTLRLPAVGAYLSVLRTATAGLAARLDFTLEEIEDLRIAVDEACAVLLASAAGGDLDCAFELEPGEIRIAVTITSTDGREPPRDSFAWTVLSALVDAVDSRSDDERRVTIDMVKRRAAATAAERS